MTRLPAAVLALLAAATVGAFFFVQHLKVTTPLIAAPSPPNPPALNPIANRLCGSPPHHGTQISFYLKHRSDDVNVYVLDQSGQIVATIASGVYMPGGTHPTRRVFTWNGLEDDGTIAPDGSYEFKVALIHQGRSVVLTPSGSSTPFTVRIETRPPRPRVVSVTPWLIPLNRSLSTRIAFTGNEGHFTRVQLYRTDLPGGPRLVKSFLNPSTAGRAVWDGMIHGRPAPAGVYLVGLNVTDAACNTGRFPVHLPPAPGATRGAGVSVRYVAALPPLAPLPAAGSHATVQIDTRGRGYDWALYGPGARHSLEHGGEATQPLSVRLPRSGPGLYELALRAGTHRTEVPLAAGATRRAPALVVLPALTWEGLDPVDDTRDGLPSTLSAGVPAGLARPLVNGLPAGFADEAALMSHLSAAHEHYELTTDLALLEGSGPPLAGHRLVVLAGSERWLPARLAAALQSYVRGGGHVLSLGLQSLRASVHVSGTGASAVALDPGPLSGTDVFGVRHGGFVAHDAGLIGEIDDGLGVFGSWSGVLPGFSAYEPITGVAAPGRLLSSAGTSSAALSVAGVRLGSGTVVEIGVAGFAGRLAGNLDARQLLDGLWAALTRP